MTPPPLYIAFILLGVCIVLLVCLLIMSVRFWNWVEDTDLDDQERQEGRYKKTWVYRSTGTGFHIGMLFKKGVTESVQNGSIDLDDKVFGSPWNSQSCLLAPALLPARKSSIPYSYPSKASSGESAAEPLCANLLVPLACQCSLVLPTLPSTDNVGLAAAAIAVQSMDVSTMWGDKVFRVMFDERASGDGAALRVALALNRKEDDEQIAYLEAPAHESSGVEQAMTFYRPDGTPFGVLRPDTSHLQPAGKPPSPATLASPPRSHASTMFSNVSFDESCYDVRTGKPGEPGVSLAFIRCKSSRCGMAQVIIFDAETASHLCTCEAKNGRRVACMTANSDVGLLLLIILGIDMFERQQRERRKKMKEQWREKSEVKVDRSEVSTVKEEMHSRETTRAENNGCNIGATGGLRETASAEEYVDEETFFPDFPRVTLHIL